MRYGSTEAPVQGCCTELVNIQLSENELIMGLTFTIDDNTQKIYTMAIVTNKAIHGPYGIASPGAANVNIQGAGPLQYFASTLVSSSNGPMAIAFDFYFDCDS